MICYEPFFFSFLLTYLREFALKFLSDIVATTRHATCSFEFTTNETRSNRFDTRRIKLQQAYSTKISVRFLPFSDDSKNRRSSTRYNLIDQRSDLEIPIATFIGAK